MLVTSGWLAQRLRTLSRTALSCVVYWCAASRARCAEDQRQPLLAHLTDIRRTAAPHVNARPTEAGRSGALAGQLWVPAMGAGKEQQGVDGRFA